MTPRMIRSALQRGELTAVDPKLYRGKTPEPPPEWPEWRRNRLRVAIRAAVLFLQGKKAEQIIESLESDGMLEKQRADKRGPVITKQRLNQYISKGMSFLVDRACFAEVKKHYG
jgi:hypothetical protein